MEGQKKKVLIVEDEMYLRIPLAEQLKSTGLQVFGAKDGVEGLETALREHPDLILLDVMMPRMNGTEMLQKLREDTWGKGALVIILTNSVERDFVKNILGAGAPEYLVKSDWDLSDLVKKVKHVLGDGEAPETPGSVIPRSPEHDATTMPKSTNIAASLAE